MWRKQEEPKPSPGAPDVVVPPTPDPLRGSTAPLKESSSAAANISKALCFQGDITGREDLYIDGEVQGSIRIEDGKVTVGPNGRVTADVEAREIVIMGKAKGTLLGHQRVQIGQTGQATGEVMTRRIAIEEGGTFRGKVELTRGEGSRVTPSTTAKTKSEPSRAVPVGAKVPQP